ncbi:Sec-independent protein translocase subunit TatA [Streptomyces sp. NPDC046985]|uniref:Sec-independent protein translocase subunit TatA n=1 Tax=Streptomyces sp. NPDC046985 TaxID=3155377 RepID=UPI003405ED84
MLRNGLEPWHLLIVAIVVIVLFGSKKLPDTARALGRSMRILKSEAKALKSDTPDAPPTQTAASSAFTPEPAKPEPSPGVPSPATPAPGPSAS